MTEEHPAITDLRARVQAMRDLGVSRWGDIELGPEPGEASEDDAPQHEEPTAAKAEEVPIRIVPRHVARLIPRVLSDE